MGEEVKQEEAKAETKAEEKPVEEKKEEKTEEAEKKEEKPVEEEQKPVEEEPKPPSPVVLFVDMHCVGCAKKIERSIMKSRGVEGVVIDMGTNQITVKGIVDPQALCVRIQKKTKRRAKILSPLPATEGEPIPQVVTSQVSGPITVELNVNMHCEACALQLKKKILKMRGVQTAETELSTGKVTVTGTMDADRLVDYVYRRTKKQARIVPQPEPEPEPEPVKEEEKKEEEEKATEEAAATKPAEEQEKKEENNSDNNKNEEENGEKKEEEKKEENVGEKKEENNEEKNGENNKEEAGNKENGEYVHEVLLHNNNEETMKKMMYYYPPLYVIERVPPPQLFSDENPNACCIS